MEITSPKGRKFSSIVQMQNAIQQDLDRISEKILRDTAKEIKQLMEKLILDWYLQYEPEYYDRTYQLLDAVADSECKVYKAKDGWKMRIVLIDSSQMASSFATKEHYFNSYMDFSEHSTYGGKKYTDWVIDWVDEGNIIGHTGIEYKDKINKLLDEKVNAGILREMKRAGFNLYR